MKKLITFMVIAVIASSGLTVGGSAHADEDDEGPSISSPQRVFTHAGITYVKLDTDTRKAIDLQIKVLRSDSYQASLRAYGQIVKPDDLLNSYQQLVGAQAKVSQARARLDASKAEYQRLNGLYQHQGASKKNLQKAYAVWRSDEAVVQIAESRKFTANSKAKARWGSLITRWMNEYSPSFKQLAAGQSRLLRLTLPLAEAPAKPPLTARLLLANATTVTVTLLASAPTTDSDLQGQSYYFLAISQLSHIPYGLGVTGLMSYGARRSGVVVPENAVVWFHGSAWAYISAGEARFVRTPVRTDMPVPGGWFQADGLRPGKRIVSRGAEVLLSVQALAEAPKSSGGDHDED